MIGSAPRTRSGSRASDEPTDNLSYHAVIPMTDCIPDESTHQMSDLTASRGTTKVCLGCNLIVPTDKDGPIPQEVQCYCSPDGRKTSWMFSDSFDSFGHVVGCGCNRCVDKRAWRHAERREGIEDATAGKPASKINIWYLDGYTGK